MNDFLNNFYDLLEETPRELINEETMFRELDEWDSMTALMLIAMFDEHYSVKLNGENIKNANTLRDLYNLTHK